ncbi:YraN family protein [Scytonema tolypothrichoides VB-61278]|nr:YraN family protein [Scytonema tolypothrichoides VB-61278]
MASQNIGEEIAGLYLQIEKGCNFVQYNLYTPDVQGEIDVVAINFHERVVYICEVAVHLITGLQYVKDARPDTEARLIKKFNKDIDYAERSFPDFTRIYMLWSPIVRDSAPHAKHDQMIAVGNVRTNIQQTRGVDIQLLINEAYYDCLIRLREYAATRTEELKSPVLRLFQIESFLGRHLKRRTRKRSDISGEA